MGKPENVKVNIFEAMQKAGAGVMCLDCGKQLANFEDDCNCKPENRTSAGQEKP